MSAANPEPVSNFQIHLDVVIGLVCAGMAAVIAGVVFVVREVLGRRSPPLRVTCAR